MERLKNLTKHSVSVLTVLKNLVLSIYRGIGRVLDKLNLPQKLYLLSLMLIFFPERNWAVICWLTMIGLSLEFWPRFTKIWHSLLGKSFLLFFYAIIANFALASAASVINDITGVDAQHLPYSHNLAILLYLPAWLIGFTFISLLIITLFSSVYIMLILLLKPFGINAVRIVTQSNYPVLTTISRMILSSIVLLQFVAVNGKDFNTFSETVNQSIEPILTAQRQSMTELEPEELFLGLHEGSSTDDDSLTPDNDLAENLKAFENKTAAAENSDERTADEKQADAEAEQLITEFFNINDNTESLISNQKRYHKFVWHSLNLFIFGLEADSLSRCKVKEGTRVVELNDYEMLEISPDKKAEFGYNYTVKPCLSVGVLSGYLKNTN